MGFLHVSHVLPFLSISFQKSILFLQKREYCLSLDGTRDICSLATGHKVVCYYIADMKNGKVEGGCAQPLTKKFERHKLANVCLNSIISHIDGKVER